MKKTTLVLGVFLFPLYIVLSLYLNNIDQVEFSQIYPPLGIVFVFTLFFFLIFLILLKDLKKVFLCTCLTNLFFFLFGTFYIVTLLFLAEVVYKIYNFIYVAWFLLISSLISLVIVKKNTSQELVKITFLVIVFLNAYVLFFIVANFIKEGRSLFLGLAKTSQQDELAITLKPALHDLPDIYFIVPDRYLSNASLKKNYSFDNSDLTSYLEEKGFYVYEDNYSNYLKTAHSLASTLNMRYINYLTQQVGENTYNLRPIFNLIENNEVIRYLKDLGYIYIHMGSWWEGTRVNKNADFNINPYVLPEMVEMLYKNTVLYSLNNFWDVLNFRERQYKKTLYQVETLKKVPEIDGPTFTFAHFLITHPPYVFDENGDLLKESFNPVSKEEDGENYIIQVLNTNKMLKDLVETILAKSKVPPIIIIQSDEGKYPYQISQSDDNFNWFEASDDQISEKLSIFSAVYLPGVNLKEYNHKISPVNTFRFVFRNVFDQKIDLLPNKIYLFQNNFHPYVFKEWKPS